jgi:cytochrome P450
MMHDEALFPNPMDFIPERYLEEKPDTGHGSLWKYVDSKLDPRVVIFGYGRR